MTETSSISQKVIRLRATGLHPRDPAEAPVNARSSVLPGYDRRVLAELRVLLAGCGGLGGEIGHGLVRDGVGQIVLVDHDLVELSNLNRQRFFQEDLYQNKALRLAHNLIRESVEPLTVIGMAMRVQDAVERPTMPRSDAVICGVDNNETRAFVARWALANRIPAIFTAVNTTADFGYVFIQKSQLGEPCFGCLFPDAVTQSGGAPCSGGASIDILKTVAGLVLYALGAQFMPGRPLNWSYKEVDLTGAQQDGNRVIPLRPGCPVCNQFRH